MVQNVPGNSIFRMTHLFTTGNQRKVLSKQFFVLRFDRLGSPHYSAIMKIIRKLHTVLNFFAVLLAAFKVEISNAGSYWSVYDSVAAPAAGECIVTEGISVPESCCTAGSITQHADVQGDDTCFVLGPDAIPFSGCVGDSVAGYGENCSGGGQAPFDAKDAEECGCTFIIEGSGCYKANDLPNQQWFVFLDGDACDRPGFFGKIWMALVGFCGVF